MEELSHILQFSSDLSLPFSLIDLAQELVECNIIKWSRKQLVGMIFPC